MADLIDKIIEDAMRQGQFDNLSGKGKPLNLDRNPHEDPEKALAHKLLHDNDFTLPWIETRNEIEKDLATALKNLQRDYEGYRATLTTPYATTAWEAATQKFRGQIDKLNKRIEVHNLNVPSQLFQRLKLDADQLIKSLTTNS